MTSPNQHNLKVLSEFIDQLAAAQADAAGTLKVAGESVPNIAGDSLVRNGVACAVSAAAIAEFESARDAAKDKLWKMSHDLSDRLQTASANYKNTDYLTGQATDACLA